MKLALVAPALTVTLDGTVATLVLLLESPTTAPPAGAGPLSVTVPVEELPPWTVVGLSVSALRVTALRHTLFVQVWPAPHVPQLSVPPQPSGALPQLKPSEEHVAGVQVVQTLLTQVCDPVQAPQLSVPPQPSEALPQLKPSPEHVFGVQGPGLSVKFALADCWLQGADAATVTNC